MTVQVAPLAEALDMLCPMHLHLDAGGRIVHAGPTLCKVLSGGLVGREFTQVFELERPRKVRTIAQLLQTAGQKLHLRLRTPPHTRVKAVLAPHPLGSGALVDMSFGISILDAVRDFTLSSADFAPTDLTIEMLYLVEAKSAAMEASRLLNERLQDAMLRVEEQAYSDTLTGLKNRRAFDHLLGHLLEGRQDFALMQLDLDFFKQVNDTLGHAAGDHVLQTVAAIMREETRGDDIVARVGGDEFILVFPGLVNRSRLDEVAARLIERIREPIPFAGKNAAISASGGVVRSVDYIAPTVDALLGDADTALYASKDAGRGRVTFHLDLPKSRSA
ncbi:GGDEF domain-containing protein [Pseudaestuariivita atlantica]|uniref:Diguanylate cyclase n=1 Tax=Pseudaestuariivita atlantica TaxID=1317121 RepID=A0A0L1JS53_9RHOB|nr:GGDEF domain-containing protein [Pseudaestuariivita atlantica]KNG94238.1 diguanylate cyclase [Pseudaestuariivita atlantica]